MIKVFDEVDGDFYLDILIEEKDLNFLKKNEMLETELRIDKKKVLHIGIKLFDEDANEKV